MGTSGPLTTNMRAVFGGRKFVTKKILDAVNVSVVLTDMDGRYVYVNKTFETRTGYSFSEVIGKTAHELNIFADEGQYQRFHQEIVAKGFVHEMEMRVRVKSGELRHCLMSVDIVREDSDTFIVGTVFDNSRQEEAREDLLKSEEKVRALINATTDAVLLTDTYGIISVANDTVAKRLGRPLGELVGKSIYDLARDDAPERRRWVQQTIKSKVPGIFEGEVEGNFIEYSIYPVLNNRNEVTMLAIFAKDITQRRRAEERLKESEERFRSLVEKSPFAIHIARNGTILFSNATSMKMFGYKEQSEIVGRSVLDIIAPRCRDDAQGKTIRLESGEGVVDS